MRLKWVLVAVAAIPTALLGWGAWTFFGALTGDPMTQAESVSCEQAMEYGDQDGLPEGAHDAKCTVLTWLDTQYTVRFTIARTGLDTWLKETYPHTDLTSEACLDEEPANACAHIELNPAADGGAMVVDVDVRYGEDSTAIVDLTLYDV